MAIVKCKECFGDVSTQAVTCPHCGAKPPKRTSLATWFGVLVVGWLVYSCAPFALDALDGSAKRLAQQVAEPERQMMTRYAFTNRVSNQAEQDLITLIGKPDSTQESGRGGNKYWYYNRRTTDPVSGKQDAVVQIIIENGKVKNVHYY